MEQLQISRTINHQNFLFTLSEDELEQAYRLKQRRYLDEDFAIFLAEEAQNQNCRFHTGHLEEFPELTLWLCQCFDDFYDANISHNDLIELTINHLHHASLTPAFFTDLARIAPAICEGVEKAIRDCEKSCSRYSCCSNIAGVNNRSKQWELLASLLVMHQNGTCICSQGAQAVKCSAAKYLSGECDIFDFFHI